MSSEDIKHQLIIIIKSTFDGPITQLLSVLCILIDVLLDAHAKGGKLQALVYDILPSTTAVFSYAIGSRKLSANKQFFVGAQTVVSLLQTT